LTRNVAQTDIGLQAYRLTGLQAYRLTGLQADRELYGGESKNCSEDCGLRYLYHFIRFGNFLEGNFPTTNKKVIR